MREPHVALDDGEAGALEEGGGSLLRLPAQRVAGIGHAREYHGRELQGNVEKS